MDEDRPEFDQERARSMVGKHVIVGLTYCDHNDVVLERVQFHGELIGVDEQLITIKLNNSEEVTLPPDLSAFTEAPPGEYRLRSTGEVVTDPDLLAQWTIQKPPPDVEHGH